MENAWPARKGPPRFSFGRFEVEVDRARVRRDGQPVALRPKTFALLVHLADRAGTVVGKQELMDAVWPGLVVTDDSLTQAISELRGALDDREQQLIKTVPKRGYLFDAAVGPTLMPFTDLSEPPAPHLALAIDTGLSTDLGRLADIRVTPRGSAAALGNSASVDLKRVAGELGARFVVTGTVRRDGERLQVNTQLVRTDDGTLLWADRFEYASAADWVEQRDISARIANLLDLRLRDAVFLQARHAPPNNRAVDHWMRGAYLMSSLATRDELQQAQKEFQAALDLQPDSSHALAGLASTHFAAVRHRFTDQREQELQAAERLARQALVIDPQSQDAMSWLAGALMFNGRIAEAMAVTQRQLALNPNHVHANRDLAAELYFSGRWEDALRQLEVAIRLNPLDRRNLASAHSMAATALIALQRYDEAIARARLVLDGPGKGGHGIIASAEAWRGDLEAILFRYIAIAAQADAASAVWRRGVGRGSCSSCA